jgi:hypothetical protein
LAAMRLLRVSPALSVSPAKIPAIRRLTARA